jgi:hypothetical protein
VPRFTAHRGSLSNDLRLRRVLKRRELEPSACEEAGSQVGPVLTAISADTDSYHQNAHHPADEGVREPVLDPGTGVPAAQAADSQRDSGRPVGSDRPVVMDRESQEGDHSRHRGHEGGRQRGRRNFPGWPSGADEDGSQDRAAADAVDSADAAHQRRDQDQYRLGNGAGRLGFGSGPGWLGQGQPGAERQKHRRHHEVEVAGTGQQFHPDG